MAANGQLVASYGRKTVKLGVGGKLLAVDFHVLDVRRPLLSTGTMAARGFETVMGERGFI